MREPQRIKLIQKGLGKAQKASSIIKYKCLLPSCMEDGIRSHSQQKKHQLKSIAEDFKVVSMEKNIYKSFSSSLKEGRSFNHFKSKQIAQASTFIGYCNAHDTEIFSPIENGKLDISIDNHNLLLFLRCFSHEFANKRNAYDRSKDIHKYCSELFGAEGARGYEDHIDGMRYFLELDAPYYLNKLFAAYENENYSDFSFNSFVIPKNIGVSSSTCISPLRENHSGWALNNFNEVQPTVAMSIVPDLNHTSVSFAWLSEYDDMCSDFSTIGIETEGLSKILNSYAVNGSEDLSISPSIWEALSAEEKKEFNNLIGSKDDAPEWMVTPQVIKI